jgi:hypothetical protein
MHLTASLQALERISKGRVPLPNHIPKISTPIPCIVWKACCHGGSDCDAYHLLRQRCNSLMRFAAPTMGMRAAVQSYCCPSFPPHPSPLFTPLSPLFRPSLNPSQPFLSKISLVSFSCWSAFRHPSVQQVLLLSDLCFNLSMQLVAPIVAPITSFVSVVTRSFDLQCQRWGCAPLFSPHTAVPPFPPLSPFPPSIDCPAIRFALLHILDCPACNIRRPIPLSRLHRTNVLLLTRTIVRYARSSARR